MKIELHEIPVREVVEGYKDSAEDGVIGYNGRLNIRPLFNVNLSIRISSVMKLFVQYRKLPAKRYVLGKKR